MCRALRVRVQNPRDVRHTEKLPCHVPFATTLRESFSGREIGVGHWCYKKQDCKNHRPLHLISTPSIRRRAASGLSKEAPGRRGRGFRNLTRDRAMGAIANWGAISDPDGSKTPFRVSRFRNSEPLGSPSAAGRFPSTVCPPATYRD